MKKPSDATSGSLTSWVQDLVSEVPFERLVEEAAAVRPDADGLIMLPYFAGTNRSWRPHPNRHRDTGLVNASDTHPLGDTVFAQALWRTATGLINGIPTSPVTALDSSKP